MRAVVIGASSGLGRCIGVGLAAAGCGSRVPGPAARPPGRGGGRKRARACSAIRCDVTEEASCRGGDRGSGGGPRWHRRARVRDRHRAAGADRRSRCRHLATGCSTPTWSARRWRPPPRSPHLQASQGAAAYLSSVSAGLTPPWPGLAAYLVKQGRARLDGQGAAHRTPGDRLHALSTVGDCPGGDGEGMTQFANDWDSDLAIELGPIWMQRNLMNGGFIEVDELVTLVHEWVSHGASVAIPHVAIHAVCARRLRRCSHDRRHAGRPHPRGRRAHLRARGVGVAGPTGAPRSSRSSTSSVAMRCVASRRPASSPTG